MPMIFDEHQREAIYLNATAVVSAGAGSGKTSVLAERFARLIEEGRTTVDRILTLTFTRKAAAEMKDRIYRRLRASHSPAAGAAIAGFDGAQISTLDSFCARVVRSDALRLGLDPAFRIDETRLETVISQAAFDFVATHRSNQTFRAYLQGWGIETTIRRLLVPLGRAHAVPGIPSVDRELWRRQETETRRRGEELLSRLVDGVLLIRSIDPVVKDIAAAQHALESVVAETQEWPRSLADEDLDAVERLLGAVGSFQLRVGKKDAALLYKEAAKELRDSTAPLVRSALETLRRREEPATLYGLVGDFLDDVRRRKGRDSLLGHADVAALAVLSLTENEALRTYYRRRFDAIMIDEFQDNNALQKRLLFLLASPPQAPAEVSAGALTPGKLFFVGDAKQSIYRFRGADVSVFAGLAEELSREQGRTIHLSANYRSRPGLIDVFNGLFRHVFSGARETFEARFEPLSAGRQEEPGLPPPVVRLMIRRGQDSEEDAGLVEAYHVAKLIHDSVTTGSLEVRDAAGARSVEYRDVALLLRASSKQMHYERMFRHFGIPYTTDATRSLFLEATAGDISALLQLIAYPEDRYAYAVVLRSPLVGLSDEGLVAALRPGGTFRPFDPASDSALSGTDADRFVSARAMFEDLRNRADREPPANLVSRIWHDYGYRFSILRRSSRHSYLEHFDYLYELALEHAGVALVDFLAVLRPRLGTSERLDEVEAHRRPTQGVRIMTVHKSKGLEFPVVILGDASNPGRTQSGNPVVVSRDHGPLLALRRDPGGSGKDRRKSLNFLYDTQAELESREEVAEVRRLLYVACTRAVDHLFVSGVETSRNRNSDTNMLVMIQEALSAEGLDGRVPTIDLEGVDEDLLRRPPAGERVSTVGDYLAAVPKRTEPLGGAACRELAVTTIVARLEAPAAGAPADSPERFGPDSDEGALPEIDPMIETARLEDYFGTLCHSMLEYRFRRGRLDDFEPPGGDRLDLGPEQFASLIAGARRLVEELVSSPQWRRIVPQAGGESELGFLLRFDEEPGIRIRGSIDYIAETEHEVVVVDFKTDRHLRPEHHSLQLAFYAEAAAELTGKPVRACLAYLRHRRLVDVEVADAHSRCLTALRGLVELESAATDSFEAVERSGPK